MRKVFIIFLAFWAYFNVAQAQNNTCLTSDPFCTGTTYDFPAGVNAGSGETGPNYGCLYSTPNPAWYYMQIDQPGDIDIYMHSNPNVDIDFACWGPFTDQDTPCTAQLTAACTSCPNNTSNPNFYPSGNLVDCSYSTSWNETVHINNALTGQWYILLITNYSNNTCNIIFDQSNAGQAGAGSTNCGIMPTPASNNGPLCAGETLILHANPVANATYHWTGPGIVGTLNTVVDSVVIPNATVAMAGVYSLTITVGSQTSNAVTTTVVINPNPTVTANNTAICSGATATVTATGATSYAWSSGQTTAAISVSPATTTTYYVLGTDANGCQDTAIATVTVNPNPTSTFTSPPVCGSVPPSQLNYATITWTGTAAPGASFFWTFGPGGSNPQPYSTSSLQGPHNLYWADVVSVTVYNISLTVTNPNTGCTSTTNGQIQVLPSNTQPGCCVVPVPDAGSDTSVCGLTLQLNAQLGPGNVGSWHQTSGPGIATFADTSLTNSFVTVNTPGQYVFQWLEHSGATCFASDFITVNFIQIPNANAGPDQIVCGNTTTMQAIPSVGTGQWSGPNALFTPSTSPTATLTTSVYNEFTYMWIETNVMCKDTDYVDILFHEVPVTDAGPNQTVCGNSVNLTGTPNGNVFSGYWTGPNGSLFSPSDTSSSVQAVILPYISQQNVTFWWHQSNEMCTDSDQVVITFQPYAGPGMVSAGFDNSTCDSVFQLHGIIQGVSGTGQWSTTDPSVTIVNSLDPLTNIFIDPSTLNYSTDSSKYEATITWTVSNGAGCTATDNVTITFYETPHANAGIDQAICGLNVKMGASYSISASVGQWTLLTSPGPGCSNPSYDDASNPGTNIQVSCYGTYTFIWRERNLYNNSCSTTDTVTIQFIEYPTISGGTDQWVCGDTVYLQAFPAALSSGVTWMTAPVTWINYNTHVADTNAQRDPITIAHHYHTTNDSVIFQWQEYNLSTLTTVPTMQCVSIDTVIVHFFVSYPAIEYVDSQWDTVQCGRIYNGLNAQTPPEGYGYWIDSVGTTDFTPSELALNATATVESYGMHHFYWVVKNGVRPNGTSVCIDTSDVIPIRFIELPVANTGGQDWAANPNAGSEIKWDTACGNKYTLHPVLNGIGTVQWQTASTNNRWFVSTHSSTTPMPNDTLFTLLYNSDQTAPPYYYEVFLQLDNSVLPVAPFSHGCIDRDTLRITFARIPTGQIHERKPFCYGQTSLITAEFDPQGQPNHFSWTFDNGVIDSLSANINTPYPFDTIYYVSWDTTGGTMYHIVSLSTSNSWGCISPITVDTIFEPTPIYPLDSVYPTTCMQPNGTIKVFAIDSLSATYYWLDPQFPNPVASEQVNLMSGVPYHVRFRYKSWDGVHFCNDTITYIIPDTGQVTALFNVLGDTVHLIPGQSDIFFENVSIGGKNWEWHFGDGTTSSAENPDHIYNTGGVFYVYLYAKSKEGCESMSDSIPIEIEKNSELTVPNIFTPNGDTKNDYFQVNAKTIKSFKGIITNRWGKTLFEWTEWNKKLIPTSGWDGKINGNDAAPGVYYYIITAEGWDNVKYDLKGAFHLEREK